MADKSNGERLREWREAQGLSQEQAAARIGAKQGTWAPWESGKKRPAVDHACELADLTDGAVPVNGWSRTKPKRRRPKRPSMQSAS